MELQDEELPLGEPFEQRLGVLGEPPPGPMLGSACRAFAAFSAGDYARVIELLEPVMPELARLGGSGAQRRVLRETLDSARARMLQVASREA